MTQHHSTIVKIDESKPKHVTATAPAMTKFDTNAVAANDPSLVSTTALNDPSFTDKWLPKWGQDVVHSIGNKVAKVRKTALEITPAGPINYASQWLGLMHVLTEMLMFKSGMKGAKLIDNPENPVNWVVEPAKKIWNDIYANAQSRDYSPMTLLRGNPLTNIKKYVMDTHDSTLREIERRPAAKTIAELKVGNPWQTRTTGTGLVIWTLSTVIPEHKESDEEIERMAKMRTLHPVKYVGERLKQAVWFPQWSSHKREMLGLGYLGIGTFSAFGSWRNRGELVPGLIDAKEKNPEVIKGLLEKHVAEVKTALSEGKTVEKSVIKNVELIEKAFEKGLALRQGYKFNWAYFGTAVVSFIGGLPLLFALDERKAYSTYGSMVVARMPLLYPSISSKVKDKEQGWIYYMAGKLTFQIEDMLFSLIGGATKKKRPDGTYEIIDHEALKKNAILEAKEEKLERKEEKLEARKMDLTETPRTSVKFASKPERLESHEKHTATTV